MTPLRLITATLLLICTALASRADYREFTDKQDRTMKAELINVMGDKVRIQREDGARFDVSPSVFSEEDEEYIYVWMLKLLAERDSLIDINAKSAGTRPKEDDGNRGVIVERWDGYYKVTLTNDSDTTIKDIRVEYVYEAFHMKAANKKRREGDTEHVKGELSIPVIAPRDEFSFDTVKEALVSTELKRGYIWEGGGDPNSKDELEGIWIRIYRGDDLLKEWSNPSSMKDKFKWTKVKR